MEKIWETGIVFFLKAREKSGRFLFAQWLLLFGFLGVIHLETVRTAVVSNLSTFAGAQPLFVQFALLLSQF